MVQSGTKLHGVSYSSYRFIYFQASPRITWLYKSVESNRVRSWKNNTRFIFNSKLICDDDANENFSRSHPLSPYFSDPQIRFPSSALSPLKKAPFDLAWKEVGDNATEWIKTCPTERAVRQENINYKSLLWKGKNLSKYKVQSAWAILD